MIFNWAMEIGQLMRSPVVALQLKREWTLGPRTPVRGYRLSLLRNWVTNNEMRPLPHCANVIGQCQQSQCDDRREPRMQIRGNRSDVHSKSQRDDRCEPSVRWIDLRIIGFDVMPWKPEKTNWKVAVFGNRMLRSVQSPVVALQLGREWTLGPRTRVRG